MLNENQFFRFALEKELNDLFKKYLYFENFQYH